VVGNPRIHGAPALSIVGALFMIVGFLGLALAGALAFVEEQSGRDARADGVIVGFAYGPIIKFTTRRGETAQFQSQVRSSMWSLGDHVDVAYDPASPSGGQIDGFAGRWFLPSLLGILFGVFLVLGVAFFTIAPRVLVRPLERDD
jgi:hypothetical protein